MDATDPVEAKTAVVTTLLLAHHPAAEFDATGAVATAGFLCSPGAPGSEQVRVAHRAPFPSAVNGRTFADNADEEFVFVAAYADLLRADGWTVSELTTGRPGLLATDQRGATQILTTR